MSRHWKEPYEIGKARRLGIKEWEGDVIVGDYFDPRRNAYDTLTGTNVRQMNKFPVNKWIYYVYVCRFTFAFFSLVDISRYIEYYSTKILPSRIWNAPHVNHDLRQSTFNRLPLYLREEPKRMKVVKALCKALADFERQGKGRWATPSDGDDKGADDAENSRGN